LPELGEVEIPADMDMRELKKFQDNPEIPFKVSFFSTIV
jgi:hypothetical protein